MHVKLQILKAFLAGFEPAIFRAVEPSGQEAIKICSGMPHFFCDEIFTKKVYSTFARSHTNIARRRKLE
jgi:hypothetical protein